MATLFLVFLLIFIAFIIFLLPLELFFPDNPVLSYKSGIDLGVTFEFVFLSIISVVFIGMAIRTLSLNTHLSTWNIIGIVLTPITVAYFFIFSFALIYRDLGLNVDRKDLSNGDFLYFSVVTWTTLGYGDLVPIHASKFFAAFEALLGSFVSSLTISLLGSLFIRPVIRTLKGNTMVGNSTMTASASAVSPRDNPL